MGEVNNNWFDCSSLGFVDSHGKSKIKGKWLLCMDFSNGREHVLGAEGETFASFLRWILLLGLCHDLWKVQAVLQLDVEVQCCSRCSS